MAAVLLLLLRTGLPMGECSMPAAVNLQLTDNMLLTHCDYNSAEVRGPHSATPYMHAKSATCGQPTVNMLLKTLQEN